MALTVIFASPAWAGYVPPGRSSAPRTSTTTTGRRGGCMGNEAAMLTALAPQSHVGQTSSTYPIFTWYVPESEVLPVEFYLYALDAAGRNQLVYQTELESTAGIMSFSLPATQPALAVGQRYRWQVVLLCDPNRPSSALVTDAEMEVVSLSTDLSTRLATAIDRTERASHFAEAGLWYDAIAAVTPTVTEPAPDPTLKASQLALLKDLADLEAAQQKIDHSQQLRQIIEQTQ